MSLIIRLGNRSRLVVMLRRDFERIGWCGHLLCRKSNGCCLFSTHSECFRLESDRGGASISIEHDKSTLPTRLTRGAMNLDHHLVCHT